MNDRYQVRFLNRDRALQAVADWTVSWDYERVVNEAGQLRVVIPREVIISTTAYAQGAFSEGFSEAFDIGLPAGVEPTKFAEAKIATYMQVYRDEELLASGKIVRREIQPGAVTIEAMTEEILLEAHTLPVDYGPAVNGQNLADFTREMLYRRHTTRIKSGSEWQSYIASSNIDFATQPGVIMLATSAEGPYEATGYAIYRFRKADIGNFEQWERVRWSADNDDVVTTSVAYKSSNDAEWSIEFEGGLPASIGTALADPDADYYDIRVTLSTTDTESVDQNDNPKGVSPWFFALEVIAKTSGIVTDGGIPAEALDAEGNQVDVRGIEISETNALKALREACEQASWEFRVIDGALNIAAKFGEDRTDEFVFRESTNMTIDSHEDSDSELVNILDAFDAGEGINALHVHIEDGPSLASYGPYPETMRFRGAVDEADLRAKAEQYMSERTQPRQTYEIIAHFEPDEEPLFHLGDTVQVAMPGGQAIRSIRIIEERREYSDEGVRVELSLGQRFPSIVDSVLDRDEEIETERGLPLLVPQHLRAETIYPGVRVLLNAYQSTRATGVEIHASVDDGFTPTSNTLVATGGDTRFRFTDLATGDRWYFKARAYDGTGEYSDYTEQVSAVSGGSRNLEPGAIDDVALFAAGLRPVHTYKSLPQLPQDELQVGDYATVSDRANANYGKLFQAIDTDGDDIEDTWESATEAEKIVGKLTAAQIGAGAIGTEQLAANEIRITDTDRTAGALAAYDTGGVQRVRIGNISGLPGVPSSVEYGLWGQAGTGVFVEGYPRMIAAGQETLTGNAWPTGMVAGDLETNSPMDTAAILSGGFTVPTGKAWVVFPSPLLIGPNNADVALYQGASFRLIVDGTSRSSHDMELTAGSYTSLAIRVSLQVVYVVNSQASTSPPVIDVSYLILENDA